MMRKEPQIFTTIDVQDVPVSDVILDTLEQEVVQETLLREYVRELLTEAAKGPQDLPADISVKIDPDPHGVTITYTSSDGGPPSMYSVNPIVGEVMLEVLPPDEELGPCGGAWMIGSTHATSGWGPMLYDVAMEYATMNGGGLVSDRGAVSPSARKVWDYYMNNRGDVKGIQLDDLKNTLTPEEEDNCFQRVAMNFGYPDDKRIEASFVDSPLSKRYTKPPTTIEALKAAGKLIWQEGGAYAPTKDLDEEGPILHLEKCIRALLRENVDRPKVVFMAGGPGSGKSMVIRQLGLGDRLKVVNPDDQYEETLRAEGIPTDRASLLDEYTPIRAEYLSAKEAGDTTTMRELEPEYLRLRGLLSRNMSLFNQARQSAKQKKEEHTSAGEEFLVDGTGGNYNEIASQVEKLESVGYDVAMIFIGVPMETSVARDRARGEQGGRHLGQKTVEKSWKAVEANRERYEDLFGDDFFYVDNDGENFAPGIDAIAIGVQGFMG